MSVFPARYPRLKQSQPLPSSPVVFDRLNPLPIIVQMDLVRLSSFGVIGKGNGISEPIGVCQHPDRPLSKALHFVFDIGLSGLIM